MSTSNNFFFIRTLWGALCHADWQEASERAGIFGLIIEFFRALLGFSAWPFFIPVDSEWHPATVRPILDAHGVESWGWGKRGNEFFFQVKFRQASWAQYLLQKHGVPLSGQLLGEAERSAYRPAPRRTARPVPGATPTQRNITAATAHSAKAEATPSLLSDPIGEINRTVDRLAKW